jgi:hypothetical protein
MQIDVRSGVARIASAARKHVTALWQALPGPTWAKVITVAVCLAIPGPLDEIAVVAVAGFLAVRKARRS